MCTDKEIADLLYLKEDSKIAHYLGISADRVRRVRAKHKPAVLPPIPIPLPEELEEALVEEPLSQESVLAPALCPTCGSPVAGGRLMITHIQALVAAYYQIPVREMTSSRRNKEVCHPRQVAMYLASELTPKSLPDIGRRFGNRDHTTVIHAIKAVQGRMLVDAEIEADVKALRERLAA
jgi:hypothetical protein